MVNVFSTPHLGHIDPAYRGSFVLKLPIPMNPSSYPTTGARMALDIRSVGDKHFLLLPILVVP